MGWLEGALEVKVLCFDRWVRVVFAFSDEGGDCGVDLGLGGGSGLSDLGGTELTGEEHGHEVGEAADCGGDFNGIEFSVREKKPTVWGD